MRYKPLRTNEGGFLPREYDVAHDLCFVIHDTLGAILQDGEEGDFFKHSITFSSEGIAESFGAAENTVEWLHANGLAEDAAKVLRCVVFPAALSDMLHCIYEALETSRKAKLNVSYMLLRKPLQENLFLFEEVVIGLSEFAQKLTNEPLLLRAGNAGGIEAHTKRVKKVLDIIGAGEKFDPKRIAELRYDKGEFDGMCNHAMHLFTEHKAIRTSPMNINFIFSGREEKVSQWDYMYMYLPYLLDYARHVVEHVAHSISMLDPRYQEALNRKIAALVLLWEDWAGAATLEPELQVFANEYRAWLDDQCEDAGYPKPVLDDLPKMVHGAFPAEAAMGRRKRLRKMTKPWKKRKKL